MYNCGVLKYDENTLDADAREKFKAEANYFASATPFQQDKFLSEMDKYDLEIGSALQLFKHFGTSPLYVRKIC